MVTYLQFQDFIEFTIKFIIFIHFTINLNH